MTPEQARPPDPVRPARPFLTARWSNVLLATFVVPPDLLAPYLPAGLELDTRDGQAFASLVAFDFLDTRVLGIAWPGFRAFPELNLRFYVRRRDERGVVFVRELVPNPFIAWTARTLYNEPYVAAPMRSTITEDANSLYVDHRISFAGRTHTMRAVASKPAYLPEPTSEEAFFKEHHWGYGKTRDGRTLRYYVWHPVWPVYPVRETHIDLDWASVYGPGWVSMQGAKPASTVLAVGSEIAVYPRGTLRST